MWQSMFASRFFWKLVLNGALVTAMMMWLAGTGFGASLIVAVVIASTSYVVGDKIVLRMTNNLVATLADALMAFLFLWFVAARSDLPYTLGEITLTAIALGIVEFVYHRFLLDYDAPERIW